MAGARKLSKVQFGIESTSGTKVDAAQIWRGVGGMPEDNRETVFPDENVGILAGVDRSYVPYVQGALSLEPTEATFEQLAYICACGIENVTAGVADGAGSGYIYTYEAATIAQKTIRTLTMEGGDDNQEEELEYCFVDQFVLSGALMETLKIQADFIGRQVATGTFTGSLSLPTVEEILFLNGKLYIDAEGGTIGATQKSNTFIGMNLNWKTGFIPVFAADGNLYFATIKQVGPEIELQVTFEHDSVAVAEKAAWRAQTPRLIRMLFEGSTLGTAGTAYTRKSLIIDLAGRWTKFNKLDERNGNDIVTGVFKARYNTTADLLASITVVNEDAAL